MRQGFAPFAIAAIAGLAAAAALASPQRARADDAPGLESLSIEELARVPVTTASKTSQPLAEAPSSIFVISNDDLRSTGALTLVESLRLAPNLQVARLDALSHVVTSRGFNSFETSNKMLVLIDGRSVYSPLFSGVFWESQNVMLEDLDRIEVISGPGGTLWGANAVNGVINVISRSAHETQGGLLHAALGPREGYASARYGGRFGATGAFRVYAMGFSREDTDRPGVDEHFDGLQGGFRTDWGDGADRFTVQGDLYRHETEAASALIDAEGELRGGNLLGRWSRELSATSALQVQAYYDRAERVSKLINSRLDSFDLQVQHTWKVGRHEIVSGAGYRASRDEFHNDLNPAVTDPVSRWTQLSNVFVQDEITLSPTLRLIGGLKLEHSSYTGAELMPNARLAWTPSPSVLLWAAVSRAVRTPSRIERDLVFPGLIENGFFETEKLIAYEVGYRGQPLPRTSLSISAFFNDYDDLRTTELSAAGGFPVHVGNGMRGKTYGLEAWGGVDVLPWWRLSAGASLLHKEFELKAGSTDLSNMAAGGTDPSYQLLLRSQMKVGDRVDLDVRLRAVDELAGPSVPAYVEADASVAYRLTDQVELALTGRNLLDDYHPEAGSAATRREAGRSVYAAVRWSF